MEGLARGLPWIAGAAVLLVAPSLLLWRSRRSAARAAPSPTQVLLTKAAGLLAMTRKVCPVLYNSDTDEPIMWWEGTADGRMAGLLDNGMIWVGASGEKTLYVFERKPSGGPFQIRDLVKRDNSPLPGDQTAARLLSELSGRVSSVHIMDDAVEAEVALSGAHAEGIASDVRVLSALKRRIEELDPPLVRAVMRGDGPAALNLIKSRSGLEGLTLGRLNAMTAAASEGKVDLVRALLAAGALAQPAFGFPLHAAARAGHLETVKVLLAAGVPVNTPDEALDTAMIAAAKFGREAVVALLLSKKADPNARNKDGATALACAEQEGFAMISAMLRAAGARNS